MAGMISLVSAFECPDLTCASISYNGTCFLHEGNNPVIAIKLFSCPDNKICNIDDYNFAWYDTIKQDNKNGTAEMSVVPYKYTTAECVEPESRLQNLLNGRRCKADFECKGRVCEFGFCRGA